MDKENEEKHTHKDQKSSPLSPTFTFSHCSVPSDRRPQRNEDAIAVDERGLAAVFDGVGGSDDGHIASQAAARYLMQSWQSYYQKSQLATPFVTDIPSTVGTIISTILQEIDKEVQDAGLRYMQATNQSQPGKTGPATLAAIAFFYEDANQKSFAMTFIHVGDCRIYLLRPDEGLIRLTDDDGLLTHLIQEGTISKEDAIRIEQATSAAQLSEVEQEYFLKRNKITQALGWEQPLSQHVQHLRLAPQDSILLCSDGIHDNLTDRDIETILREEHYAGALVAQALQRSRHKELNNMRAKPDDISAVLMTYREQ